MNLPEGIEDRDLIDHLFARVEQIEGSLRVYRALTAALAAALPRKQRAIAMERMALLKSDELTQVLHPRGQGLRPAKTHSANQATGLEMEWRQVAELLKEHAPG